MTLLFNNINDILDDGLTLSQRGILITILLSKDPDERITLAKFKVKVNMRDVKKDLISLHETGWVRWSGYKRAVKSESKKPSPEAIEAIEFFNKVCGRKFDHNSESTIKNLENRLKDHSLLDIKKVISNRYLSWRDDPVMSKHLNPTTIFRPSKFDKYLEEALRTNEGSAIVQAERVDLKHCDEITYAVSKDMIDSEVYSIREYSLNGSGEKLGVGALKKIRGKNIKNLLKIQKNRIDRGGVKEFMYTYQKL